MGIQVDQKLSHGNIKVYSGDVQVLRIGKGLDKGRVHGFLLQESQITKEMELYPQITSDVVGYALAVDRDTKKTGYSNIGDYLGESVDQLVVLLTSQDMRPKEVRESNPTKGAHLYQVAAIVFGGRCKGGIDSYVLPISSGLEHIAPVLADLKKYLTNDNSPIGFGVHDGCFSIFEGQTLYLKPSTSEDYVWAFENARDLIKGVMQSPKFAELRSLRNKYGYIGPNYHFKAKTRDIEALKNHMSEYLGEDFDSTKPAFNYWVEQARIRLDASNRALANAIEAPKRIVDAKMKEFVREQGQNSRLVQLLEKI